MSKPKLRPVLAAVLFLLATACSPQPDAARLQLALPLLSHADYHWIAARIFENETRGQTQNLTYWGTGEDFPSLGIGHFIWFPAGVEAPFDESFPAMMDFVAEHASECSPLPAWLRELVPLDAPWPDKANFDIQQQTEQMVTLREWLAATALQQARYIIASFSERWNALNLPANEKLPRTVLLQRLLQTSRGLFAVIDYYNFKGLGSNPRERYAGEGWGLVQVLGDIATDDNPDDAQLVEHFAAAAAQRLTMRVDNSPSERSEARWLEGWHKRIAAYNEAAPELARNSQSQYRVAPFLQHPSSNGMTLVWFSEHGTPGQVSIDVGETEPRSLRSMPRKACELAYHLAEFRDLDIARALPYRHEVVLDELLPGQRYRYEVVQDGENATGEFRLPGGADASVRFAVYADSETEPESSGKHARWPGSDDESRLYLVDQTVGYAANLNIIAQERPDFVAIAGDLVESGGEQRDWDEFWRHNASIAASVPIVPARGNHEYYGGPGDLGAYSNAASRRAIDKYKSYFGVAPWYVLDYGPLALIVIDPSNGTPEKSATDTNWYLSGENSGGVAPLWQAGSAQLDWLRQVLAHAKMNKRFTFVMFHAAPYSSGVHGNSPGVDGGENFASGRPLRVLTEIFRQYDVAAVFNGHDEMYEHSLVQGVHYFTVGIGGDGLRGPDPGVKNSQQVFLAHEDAAEITGGDGVLLDGGKHYGHLTVDVSKNRSGVWQARIEPVYVFPHLNSAGEVRGFERRVYDDVLILEGGRDN